jgi:adenylate kinase family enzyme
LIIEKAVKNISAPGKRSGFLLNNYPQNVIQAQSLDMAFARANQPLDASIIIETTKMSQNRVKRALIRYYRSQNKLILIEESSSIEDICSKIYSIHNKRRKNSG